MNDAWIRQEFYIFNQVIFYAIKIIFYIVRKFFDPKMAKNGQNLAIFGQNSHFWVFLAYVFQTPL